MAAEGFDKKIDRQKMKIGILTFHRAHNYGAVLQCYALQEILRRRGHDVRVIDYRQPWIEEFYKLISIRMLRDSGGLSGAFAYLKKNAKKFLLAPCRSLNFRRFRDAYLDMTAPCDAAIPQDFDCYVIGSDQLWSLHCLGGKTDLVYMGKFDRSGGSRVVGYAISADMKSIQTIESDLKEWTDSFDELSMREAEVADKVSEITGRRCDVCLDPTLLTDADIWNPVLDERWKDRNYVLVYEVRWEKKNKGLLRRKAEELAAKIGEGCEVIDLSAVKYSVRDFVSLFRYARYVLTTSFHGTVFSILFETPFYAFPLWNGYDLRYVELLSSIGAEDRLVDPCAALEPVAMDFGPVKSRLEERCADSFLFIDKALSDEK